MKFVSELHGSKCLGSYGVHMPVLEICFILILIVVAIEMCQSPQMPEFLAGMPEHGSR